MDYVKKYNEQIEELPPKKDKASVLDELIYLRKIEVVKDAKPLKSGLIIEIKSPVLFLVGDNGSGKSTMMDCLSNAFGFKDDTYLKRSDMKKNIKLEGKACKVQYIDFHAGDKKFSGAFGDNISLQINQMKASAGESTLMQFMKAGKFIDGILLLDEPCRGLSIKNQLLVAKIIRKKFLMDSCQIICSTHSDVILRNFKTYAQYFEMSMGKDVTYDEYIKSQLGEEEK